MATSVSPLDPRETLPMTVQNMTFMIDRLHKDCSPLQFVRELTENAIEAIRSLPGAKAGEVVWDVDWNRYDLTRIRKLAVIDTGIGMTGKEMVRYINSLSASMHQQSVEGNFGVGAKIAAVPRNHAGLVYLSWKDRIGYMIHVWQDPQTSIYGLRKFERPDGTSEYWTSVEDTIKPGVIKDHGTMVILLGDELDVPTIQAPPGAPMASRWILRYLNSRYYRFPEGIVVKAREGWELPRGDSHNFLRTVTGMRPWLDKNASESGVIPLTGAQAHWWILNENLDLDSGHYISGGHVAALYQEELYEVQAGRSGVSRLQAFGLIFGHSRVVIYVEPKGDTNNRLTSNTARTSLLLNEDSLPWVDWATEFRESMPAAIKKLVEEVGANAAGHDHRASIRERLRQIMDLFKMSRYRPSPTSTLTVEEPGEGLGGTPRQNAGTGVGESKRSGGSGGRAGDIYALFQTPLGNPGEEVRSPVPEPKVRWVSVADRTRTAPDLEDRAAKYLPEQNQLLINADFRVFTDMVDRWCKRYSHVPGARPAIEQVVREWFEQQLVEAAMGALALRGSSLWTIQDLERTWTEEALTAVVLPRYHIDGTVRRTLGAKLGSLKEHVA
jgi:hypothetical protein